MTLIKLLLKMENMISLLVIEILGNKQKNSLTYYNIIRK